MTKIKCIHPNCYNEVTHILVDYNHEIIVPRQLFCDEHALEDNCSDKGREECPCCDDYNFIVEDNDGKTVELSLTPIYPRGTLDYVGCCYDHP